MTRTVIGKLDYDGDVARIELDAVPTRKMLAKVAAFLRAKPMKGQQVVAQIIEEGEYAGWIERIEPLPLDEKLKQHGFGQPTPSPGEAAANAAKDRAEGAANMAENARYAQELAAGRGKAPETPAPATAKEPAAPSEDTSKPKKVEGQIVFLDKAAHRITIKDKAGVSHSFLYGKPLEEKIGTLQQWWFTGVIGEFDKEMNSWIATGISFFQRPDDWPARPGGGKGSYQPRNERLITFLALHRDSVALFQTTTTPDTVNFKDAERIVYEQAKKALEQAMKDFGVT